MLMSTATAKIRTPDDLGLKNELPKPVWGVRGLPGESVLMREDTG